MSYQFVNGHFTATFNGSDIGTTEEGFEIVETPAEEEIKTDDSGEVVVEGINLGHNVKVRLTYMEYIKIKAAIYTNMTKGQPLALVGTHRTSNSAVLKLTPVAGTTAETDVGAGNSYYFYLSSVNEEVITRLATKCRRGPVTFSCLPDSAHSNKAYEIKT